MGQLHEHGLKHDVEWIDVLLLHRIKLCFDLRFPACGDVCKLQACVLDHTDEIHDPVL